MLGFSFDAETDPGTLSMFGVLIFSLRTARFRCRDCSEKFNISIDMQQKVLNFDSISKYNVLPAIRYQHI